MYDTIILGGGPAGVAAGIYAARKKLNTLVIAQEFGGQSVVSDDIQNWIGTKSISGLDLAKNLEEHLRAQEGIEIQSPAKVTSIKKEGDTFMVSTDKDTYQAKTVILSIGARHRKLEVPGEADLDGKGVAYCSTCDAPLFAGKSVAVIGGGNAGLEAAQDLIPYAQEVYLLTHGDALRGDPITIEAVKKSDKFKDVILNADIQEVLGDKFVTGLKYKDKKSGEEKTLDVEGIFVEIGTIPNTEIVKGLVDLDERGHVIVDHKTGATSLPGIYAAGDITDTAYRQNNISAGDGVKAALSAYQYLLKRK